MSLALFVRRLFTHNRKLNAILCWSLLGITIAWGVVALFVLLIGCSPDHFFTSSGATTCPSYVSTKRSNLRHTTHLATDRPMASRNDIRYPYRSRAHDCSVLPGIRRHDRIASEVACDDCVRIQTCVSGQLWMSSSVLTSLRVVAFSAEHLRRLSQTVGAEDKGLSFIPPAIWIQVWLGWSLISASIPSFRSFMKPFDNISIAKTDDTYSASRSEVNGAYLMMGPLKSNHRSNMASARSGSQGLNSDLGTRTSVHHARRDRGVDENQSISSETGIIRKDVQWAISHDHEPL